MSISIVSSALIFICTLLISHHLHNSEAFYGRLEQFLFQLICIALSTIYVGLTNLRSFSMWNESGIRGFSYIIAHHVRDRKRWATLLSECIAAMHVSPQHINSCTYNTFQKSCGRHWLVLIFHYSKLESLSE